MNPPPPVISIDVEDWLQSTWNRDLPITTRSRDNTLRLLDLLDRLGIKTTMFILGKFAEAFPETVKRISRAGHEVSSHGYGHREIFAQSRDEFREDVYRSKQLLEDITGEEVKGYRAPDFSIVTSSLWALEILAELGHSYDSSIFPVAHPRYGIADWPTGPVKLVFPGGRSIIEFPIATINWLGRNWPIGGGGYHRLLPGRITRRLVRTVLPQQPFVFYCHPYEFDWREMLELRHGIPLQTRLYQGLGRDRFKHRFIGFVRAFGGLPFRDIVNLSQWPEKSI